MREKGLITSTRNRHLTMLSAMFNKGLEWGLVVEKGLSHGLTPDGGCHNLRQAKSIMLYWKSGRPELKASALTPESGGDSQFGQSAGPSQNRQDGHTRRCLEQTGRNSAQVLICIGLTYILSSCVTGPVGPEAASEKWHWRSGPIYLGRPIVTSGDSPHYLLIVNSLLEDLDLDLANNHHQISLGDWDAGTRVRLTAFGGHIETDTEGRKLSFHPFFRPAVLALLAWPWRGTEWVESICIWLTVFAVWVGFIRFRSLAERLDVVRF